MGLNQLQEVLETPAENSKKMTWRIQIAVPREKVWQKIFDKQSYTIWTSAFCEGCYYEGEWTEGSVLHFLAPGRDGAEPSGMVGVVRELRPPEFSSVEHIGIWMDGKMDTSSAEAQAWAPAFENYTLKSVDAGTELIIELDVAGDYIDMFDEIWPKALAKLKEICE